MGDARPPPAFAPGDPVEVVPGAVHRNAWRGAVHRVVWHHKDRRWNFYITRDGRAVSTRYLAEDLRRRPD